MFCLHATPAFRSLFLLNLIMSLLLFSFGPWDNTQRDHYITNVDVSKDMSKIHLSIHPFMNPYTHYTYTLILKRPPGQLEPPWWRVLDRDEVWTGRQSNIKTRHAYIKLYFGIWGVAAQLVELMHARCRGFSPRHSCPSFKSRSQSFYVFAFSLLLMSCLFSAQ